MSRDGRGESKAAGSPTESSSNESRFVADGVSTTGAATPGGATFAKPGATEHGLAASYTSTITAKRPATPNSCEEDPLQIRGGILEPFFDRPLSMQHVWMAGGQDADL